MCRLKCSLLHRCEKLCWHSQVDPSVVCPVHGLAVEHAFNSTGLQRVDFLSEFVLCGKMSAAMTFSYWEAVTWRTASCVSRGTDKRFLNDIHACPRFSITGVLS